MYQGWLTKWTPPKRAGKLSWGGKRNTHRDEHAFQVGPGRRSGEDPSLRTEALAHGGKDRKHAGFLAGEVPLVPSLLPSPLTPQLKDDRAEVPGPSLCDPHVAQERDQPGPRGSRDPSWCGNHGCSSHEPRAQVALLSHTLPSAPALRTDYHGNGCTCLGE